MRIQVDSEKPTDRDFDQFCCAMEQLERGLVYVHCPHVSRPDQRAATAQAARTAFGASRIPAHRSPSRMKSIRVDPAARVVRAEPGVIGTNSTGRRHFIRSDNRCWERPELARSDNQRG